MSKNIEKILQGLKEVNYNDNIRKYIIKNNILGNSCNECGISLWKNKILTLEIHHINGNRKHNIKSNLQLLCPNCHSLTNNHKVRKNRIEVDEENWKEVIEDNSDKSINYILTNILKTHNTQSYYNKVKFICNQYNLPLPTRKKKNIVIKEKKLKNKFLKYKELLDSSNIDFSKRTWGVEVSKLLGITPQYSLNLIKNKYRYLLPY